MSRWRRRYHRRRRLARARVPWWMTVERFAARRGRIGRFTITAPQGSTVWTVDDEPLPLVVAPRRVFGRFEVAFADGAVEVVVAGASPSEAAQAIVDALTAR